MDQYARVSKLKFIVELEILILNTEKFNKYR